MSFFHAILLGIVQGLTEFFPISSSAHLQLAKLLLGISPEHDLIYFDLTCHLGTLFSLILVLRKSFFSLLLDPKKWGFYLLAILPLIPIYFLFQPLIKTFSGGESIGYFLMLSGLFLFLASRKKKTLPDKKWQHVVCIGIAQALALVPGVSRSGSTISAARMCGWSFKEAALFSFFLSIPTILGGQCIELFRKTSGNFELPFPYYTGAFLAAFFTGLATLRLALWMYESSKVKPFAWYCILLGALVWGMFRG